MSRLIYILTLSGSSSRHGVVIWLNAFLLPLHCYPLQQSCGKYRESWQIRVLSFLFHFEWSPGPRPNRGINGILDKEFLALYIYTRVHISVIHVKNSRNIQRQYRSRSREREKDYFPVISNTPESETRSF